MSAMEHLEMLARGDRPEDAGLLGTAKLSWSRVDRQSEEDILATFAGHPLDAGASALRIETEIGAAIVGDNAALLADVYGGRIGRLWRVGDEVEEEQEPVLHVAFDTDMNQWRNKVVHFRPEDHPQLPVERRERMLALIEELVDERRRAGALRVRAFVVRAFGDARGTAALVSLFSLSNTGERSASMDYAAAALDETGRKFTVVAKADASGWTPRL